MPKPRHTSLHSMLLVALGVGVLLQAGSSARAFDEVIDSPMYHLPDFPTPPTELVFPDELKSLWLRALERPEVEMRLKAAATIATAHQRGMKGLEATIGPLVAALDAPDQHPAVRLTAAQTLIALDARQSAPSLFAQAQTGDLAFREAVEPALARWDHRPARAAWLARLAEPGAAPRSLILAIHELGVVREEQAVARLRELAVASGTPTPIKVEAARALGAIRAKGLEKDAEALAVDPTPSGLVARIAAVDMLRRHSSPAAVALLQRLARDPEPAVAVVAVGRLIEIDPALALPLLDILLASADPDLRSHGVEAAHRSPTKERVLLLGARLQDVHPDVRKKARARLLDLAKNKELQPHVLGEGMRVLGAKDWRGLEQATILLVQLEHRPAAKRLLELLSADRPEVFVTAAWGLRKLAVAETLPAITKYVADEHARVLASKPLPGRKAVPKELIDHQLSQLNQFLGQERYRPAEPVLRAFVPKRDMIGESRAAAVWALSLIHEGVAIPALIEEMEARLHDTTGVPPEDPRVRRMIPIAYGRMKAVAALPPLRKYWYGKPTGEPVSNACGWAIERITGEVVPAVEPVRSTPQNWFLRPAS